MLVNTAGPDHQGCLLFVDRRLVAVLVRLEQDAFLDPEFWGHWFLEAGFGPCQPRGRAPSFATTDEALGWARQQVEQYVREAVCLH
ncbi:conserved hypothetical protein [Methylobacterium sp. 4-46]|nr:conserved hypothetical protein [Methylobacterium sp. 4-46]